jgi:hypothetical protein
MHPKRFTRSLVITALALTAPVGAAKVGEWSEATNLGSALNSAFSEGSPAISKNGLSLYLHSDRPGLGGPNDLYVSQRSHETAAWGPAVPLGIPMNSSFNEVAPALSRDGHYLFFSTDRPGGPGLLDIWVSYRRYVHDDFAWGDPVPVESVNAPAANDAGVAYFENDGGRPQLFFQSTRPGGAGMSDFYMSEQRADGTWGLPTYLAELSSPLIDNRITLRHDGRELFFFSNRAGSIGNDIWTSARATLSDAWSAPVKLGSPVNTATSDGQPGLSADGEALYFASDRPGSLAGDIWVTTRPRGKH